MRPGAANATALFALGAALGAGITAGAALLLYTGQGFLGTAGFLIAVSMAALAAGLWVGSPDPLRPGRYRSRWYWTVIAFTLAGGFAALWDTRPEVQEMALGGPLAVLLLLAEPAYAGGSLLAGVASRRGRNGPLAGVPALLGAGAGVLLATTTLIPALEPPGIFLGAAALLAVIGRIESARPAPPGEGSDMTGKVVIITGVSDEGQVGFIVAQRFREAGARLVITSASEGALQLAPRFGDDVAAIRADLTTDEGAASVVAAARERFGRVDALINVAGGLRTIAPVAETDSDAWRTEVERNAGTVLRMCREALPLLRQSRGAIINFASPAGARAVATLGAYSAAKAAVIALTRSLALEEKKHGVRANAIAPGTIDTASNREAEPERTKFVTREQIADVVVFLASSASSGISGETIHVLGDS